MMDALRHNLAATIRRNGGRREDMPSVAVEAARNRRSLQSCHRLTLHEPRRKPVRDSGGYVPELSARLEDDGNLTDGARRCARKIAEYAYRCNRETRTAEITVTYLQRALGKCRRTVQRYLRQLEREG
jgi:hypothetical protein